MCPWIAQQGPPGDVLPENSGMSRPVQEPLRPALIEERASVSTDIQVHPQVPQVPQVNELPLRYAGDAYEFWRKWALYRIRREKIKSFVMMTALLPRACKYFPRLTVKQRQ